MDHAELARLDAIRLWHPYGPMPVATALAALAAVASLLRGGRHPGPAPGDELPAPTAAVGKAG